MMGIIKSMISSLQWALAGKKLRHDLRMYHGIRRDLRQYRRWMAEFDDVSRLLDNIAADYGLRGDFDDVRVLDIMSLREQMRQMRDLAYPMVLPAGYNATLQNHNHENLLCTAAFCLEKYTTNSGIALNTARDIRALLTAIKHKPCITCDGDTEVGNQPIPRPAPTQS